VICDGCFQRYLHTLFDACDRCGHIYEVHFDVFHVIDGEVLCVPCKESVINKWRESRSDI
jgi:hypothetical protein